MDHAKCQEPSRRSGIAEAGARFQDISCGICCGLSDKERGFTPIASVSPVKIPAVLHTNITWSYKLTAQVNETPKMHGSETSSVLWGNSMLYMEHI